MVRFEGVLSEPDEGSPGAAPAAMPHFVDAPRRAIAPPRSFALEVAGLAKRHPGAALPVVRDLSVQVREGELFALIGPSGCGKTSTLRLIAGLDAPDRGRIAIAGRVVCDLATGAWVPPEKRGLGFVFQDYALFPHLDVLANAMFGLRAWPRRDRRRRALEMLEQVGLADLARRYPATLSGGQQQRVALARALAPAPPLVLLDEPFNSLDAGLRAAMRGDLRRLLSASGTAAVLVTHDQEEALSIADRVGVLRDGVLVQQGSPEALYHQPCCAFVARFLGTTNVLCGQAQGATGHVPHLGEVPLDRTGSGSVMLSLRPEDLTLEPPRPGCPVARVMSRQFKGHDVTYVLSLGAQELVVQALADCPYREGEQVALRLTRPAVVLDDAPEHP